MKVEIEKYRGWQISFDIDKETFYAQSDDHDRGETKKSFAAAKTYIDEFIKENNTFKPVWIEKKPNSFYGGGRNNKIKLIGIRKDKRFVFENEKGEKEQLSEYNEKDYIIVNPENEKYYKQLADCDDKMEAIREEKNAIEKKIIGKGLEDIKKQYSI
jgi:hypothetical protein